MNKGKPDDEVEKESFIMERVKELNSLYKSVNDEEIRRSITDTLNTLRGDYELNSDFDYCYESEIDEFGKVEEIE